MEGDKSSAQESGEAGSPSGVESENHAASPYLCADDEDSDDDPIVLTATKKKLHKRIILEDSSDEDEDTVNQPFLVKRNLPAECDIEHEMTSDKENVSLEGNNKENIPLADSDKENVHLEDSDKEDVPLEDSDKENVPLVQVGRENASPSDSDKENCDEPTRCAEFQKSLHKRQFNMIDTSDEDVQKKGTPLAELFDAEVIPPEGGKSATTKTSEKDKKIANLLNKSAPLPDDLFDAEMDSSDEEENRKDEYAAEGEPDAGADGDSEDDEEMVLSDAIRRRLSKGAARKEKKPSRTRSDCPKKEDLQTIHSETQRLIRESEVRIPYHKPQPVGLSVFLARTQQKQAQLSQVLKTRPRCTWKTAPGLAIQPKLPCPSSDDKSLVNRVDRALKEKENTAENNAKVKSVPTTPDDPPANNVEQNESTDLCAEKSTGENMESEMVATEEIVTLDEKVQDEKLEAVKTDQADGEKSKDLGKKPEQDSGFFTGPSSEEENSWDKQVEKDGKASGEGTGMSPSASKSVVLAHTRLTPKLDSLKLKVLAPVMELTPTLGGEPDMVIDLDDEMSTPKPAGVQNLMERLLKQSKRKVRKAREIELHVVAKERKEDSNKEELVMSKIMLHIDAEEAKDPALEVPGAKLVLLKQKLQKTMKAKRDELRQKRQEAMNFDNEEGFLDEEEELTDQTDTDVEESEPEEEPEEDDMQIEEDEEKETNPFVDDEAEEDDLQEDDMKLQLDLDDEDESVGEIPVSKPSRDFLKAALVKTKTLDLFDDDAMDESPVASEECDSNKLAVSKRPFEQLSQNKSGNQYPDFLQDEEDKENKPVPYHSTSLLSDHDGVSLQSDTSFDLTLFPAGQGQSSTRKRGRGTPDLYTPSSKSSVSTVSTLRKGGRTLSEVTMPIEDTQDLLGGSSPPRSQAEPTDFHFNLDDSESQSQMLDAEGLLKVKSSTGKVRRQLQLDSQDNMDELLLLCSGTFSGTERLEKSSKSFFGMSQLDSQDSSNMDELLGLCSGRFVEQAEAAASKSAAFLSTQSGSQDNMDELLGLCSGQFTRRDSPVQIRGKKRKQALEDEEECDEDVRSTGSFEVVSDGEVEEEETEELNSEEEEEEEDSKGGGEDGKRNFHGFKSKQGTLRKEFLDVEAELSGSEYDSDEDYDIDEKDDVMELEEGDNMEVPEEEELRNQIGRVHLKSMIDEDKRQLRLMQEMYLVDGDLTSENGRRQRKFRWKNVDEDTQDDLFQNSDEEAGEEETEEETKWRLERHEREKFLKQQQKEASSCHSSDVTEDTVITLGKVVFKPKGKTSASWASKAVARSSLLPPPSSLANKTSLPSSVFKIPPSRCGSFLSRSKDCLSRIAEMTRPVSNLSGARNSGTFVFTALSHNEKAEMEKKNRPPNVCRSASVPATSSQPNQKRPRLDKSTSLPKDSIFNLL